MRAVGAQHVLAMGGRLPVVAPPVRRQSLAAIEDLDRVRGVADLDLLADQLERHAIDVALDIDVVVDVDAAPLPVRQDVTRGRQGSERRAVDLLVQGAAADAQLLHGPVVELVEQECARLTGGGWPVRVRQEEGVTNHLHPESCARRCEAAGEALTGARTGRAIEHRKNRGSGAPRLFLRSKATPTSPRW